MKKNYMIQFKMKSNFEKVFLISLVWISFTFLSGLTMESQAQSARGKVVGKLVDSETGEALIGANVLLVGTNMGAAADLEGNYTVANVPAGKYTLIITMMGYARTEIRDVEVKPGQVTRIDASIKPEVLQADEVVVTAKAIRNTEAVLLKDRQKAIAVSDAVSAEAISRAGSGNAAEAMKQVTGASVVDGKYVFVRGLGDRYTSTQLNGAEIPSNDPYRRAGSVDLIPANLVDNIITVKTFTPDKQGNFSGGTVDIKTKDFPDRLDIKFSAKTSFNTSTSFNNNAIGYKGSKTDWLGMDDGFRGIPDVVESGQIPAPDFDPELLDKIISMSRSFNPQMAPTKTRPPLNQSYSFSAGNQINLFNRPLGYLASLSYSKSYLSYDDGQYNAWSLGSSAQQRLDNVFQLNDTRTKEEVLWGGLLKTSYKVTPNNILGVNFIYNINGESTARLLEGRYDYDKLDNIDDIYRSSVLSYNQRQLMSVQATGDHLLKSLFNSKVAWKFSLSNSRQEEPDLRYFTNYTEIEGEKINTGVFTNLPPTRLYRDLEEKSKEGSVDLTIPFKQWAGKASSLKLGGFVGQKGRDFSERSFLYSYVGSYNGNPEAYFSANNVRWDSTSKTIGNRTYYGYDIRLYMKNGDIGANDYRGDQTISAGYAMMDLPLLDRIRLIMGARYEKTDIELISLDETKADGAIVTEDLLPSVSLITELKNNMNLRATVTRTLARPNFRELAPYASFDFAAGFTHIGNPELKRTLIDNYDLRWEWFSRPGEIYAVSLFYKEFENPIERAFIIQASNREITWINVDRAKNMGIELEFRKNLDIVHSSLRHFLLGTNFSLVKSRVDIPAAELQLMRINNPEIQDNRELEGQSPFLLNVNLGYDDPEKGFAASIYYNVFGQRLSETNKNGQPFVYEQPFSTLNASFDWNFMRNMKLRMAANNLLDQKQQKTQVYRGETYIFTQYRVGRTFELGISYSL